MFPKRKFKAFCNQHNIDVSDWNGRDYVTILFSETNIEHITSTPLSPFIYINFRRKEYDETNFQYKPFKNVYDAEWDEDGEKWFNYDSYGQMTVPLPIHLYPKDYYTRLFTAKTLSHNNTLTATIPFNTIEQLEHLYTVVYPKLNKDIKDFYNGESFQNTLQTYNDTLKTYKEGLKNLKTLKKGAIDLLDKSYNITKKKAEIEDEFTI